MEKSNITPLLQDLTELDATTIDNIKISKNLRGIGIALSDINHAIEDNKQSLARGIDTAKTAISYEINLLRKDIDTSKINITKEFAILRSDQKAQIDRAQKNMMYAVVGLFVGCFTAACGALWFMLDFALKNIAK